VPLRPAPFQLDRDVVGAYRSEAKSLPRCEHITLTGVYRWNLGEEHEAYRKGQDEKAAKEEEARNARMEKESTRKAWIRNGGSAADFEKAWPELRDEGRRRRVMDADKHAREMMRAHGLSRI
jgi:hypothetical protein